MRLWHVLQLCDFQYVQLLQTCSGNVLVYVCTLPAVPLQAYLF
jgi:hypothetical protein